MAEQQVDAYGGTIFSGAADVPTRTRRTPTHHAGRNRQIAFATGIHQRLEDNLPRLEPRTALRVWHSHIPHYRVKPGIELDYTIGVRSVDSFGDGARRIRVIPSTHK